MSVRNRLTKFINQHLFFQVYVEKEIGNSSFENKPSEELLNIDTSRTGHFKFLLDTNNWNKHKDDFYTQRISSYKDSYTLDEKIKLELEALETIEFVKRDNKVLADRYKALLENKKSQHLGIDKHDVVEPEYKSQILFNVGLLMASGKLDKYYTVSKKNKRTIKQCYSAPKIAEELQNSNYQKHILATINNYDKENPNGNKNIFNSNEMMQNVITHCNENNIKVTDYFLSHLPSE